MRSLQLIHGQTSRRSQANRRETDSLEGSARNFERHRVADFPTITCSAIERDDARWPYGKGEFFRGLSLKARRDFELLATHFQCPGSAVLIREQQIPLSVHFLLEGEVNISMNSFDGKRFLLGVAVTGDILGLSSALSGDSSEITAEARFPCKIASLHRQDFLDFLLQYPDASQNVARELSFLYRRTCERLRILGLITSVPARLARLVLEWCRDGQPTKRGIQIRCALTHGEIGECIGASRETVTRTLTDFKNQDLVILRGSTLIVPSRVALASYAGIDSSPDPSEPAA
jgi:CRP/FNR family cyclic AMP-dependent transcriptional regulator